MTLPHAFYFDSRFGKWWYRLTGADGVTFYFWTFFSVPLDANFDRTYLAHERTHTPQWLRWSLVGAALVLLATHAPAWLALGFLGGFPVRYEGEMTVRAVLYRCQGRTWAAAWQHAYNKHSLEQEARRASGEPLR